MKKGQKAYLPVKRFISIFGSFFGILVCFSFLWWWVTIVNLFVTKGHPFFGSKRIGKNGKEFKLLKFRSMKIDADPEMTAGNENVEAAMTGFGRFLRKSSIDETLQLFNVFIGQMAFIGPRPLINVDVDAITIQKRKENGSISLRPGISGYAQIHTRANLDYLQKAEYDYIYYQKISFWFDIKIFFSTIFGIFSTNKGK